MNVAHGISSFPSWKGLSLTTDMAQNKRIGLLGNPVGNWKIVRIPTAPT